MWSITTRLAISLSLAAAVIFPSALTTVIWLDLARDSTVGLCEVVTDILDRATVVQPGQSLGIRATRDLKELWASSPGLWYMVAFKGLTAEFGPERRPVLPIALPYSGPFGRSVINTVDQSVPVCLTVLPRDDAELVVMVRGEQVAFHQYAKTFVRRNGSSLLLIALAFALIVALGAFLSARFVARSIERVTRLALAIEPTAPQSAISLDDVPLELKPLVKALNRAFDEIDSYIQRQRRFLGNAAHQLRTPLTLLRAKIEDVTQPDLRAELVRDVRRLSSLVSAMLDLARLQNQAIEKLPIDLLELTRGVLADFSPSALDAGIDLSLEQIGPGPVVVYGADAAIRSALSNLVANALIHAKGAGRIVAILGERSVSISDDGSGIGTSANGKAIEPFQAGDVREGAGLGLAIVQEIMAAHGGKLTVTTHRDSGTTACMRFPDALAPLEGSA